MTAIRKITSEDRDFFIAASKAFYASAAVAHDVPASYHLTTFEELMNSEVYQSGYILEVDGASAGYALVSKTFSHEAGGTVWWLEELYILPEYRGKGLGRSYFDFIEKAAAENGVRRLRLEVEPDNTRAAKLYSNLGYKPLNYSQMLKEF